MSKFPNSFILKYYIVRFAHRTLLRYVGKISEKNSWPPLDQILDPLLHRHPSTSANNFSIFICFYITTISCTISQNKHELFHYEPKDPLLHEEFGENFDFGVNKVFNGLKQNVGIKLIESAKKQQQFNVKQ